MRIQSPPILPKTTFVVEDAINPKGAKLFSVIAAEDEYAMRYKVNKLHADRKYRWTRFLIMSGLISQLSSIYDEIKEQDVLIVAALLEFIIEEAEKNSYFKKKKKKKKSNK